MTAAPAPPTPVDRGGFTAVPHDLLEALAGVDLNGAQFRVVLSLFRQTLGWRRETVTLRVVDIATTTNLHPKAVSRELRVLATRGIIVVERQRRSAPATYTLVTDPRRWNPAVLTTHPPLSSPLPREQIRSLEGNKTAPYVDEPKGTDLLPTTEQHCSLPTQPNCSLAGGTHYIKDNLKDNPNISTRSRVAKRASPDPDPDQDVKPSRPRDPLWDALVAVLGYTPTTAQERAIWNRNLKELRAVNATAEEIHTRAAAWRARYQVPLTLATLLRHWSSLAAPVAVATSRTTTMVDEAKRLIRQREARAPTDDGPLDATFTVREDTR